MFSIWFLCCSSFWYAGTREYMCPGSKQHRCLGAITSLGQPALAHVAPNIFARAFLQKCPGPCSLSPWNNSPTLLYFKAIGTLLPLEPHFSRLLSLPGHVHWPCHGNGFDSSHESSLEGGRLCQLPGALRNDWWLVDECSKEKSGSRILKEATVHQSVAAHFINGIKLWILPGTWAQHASLTLW
jgi:hypothetical protein